MKREKTRRSNEERSETTRSALLSAARKLFSEKGFAETGTPEIVAAAGVTRGALYHQFRDKADLLAAVLQQEAQAVTAAIEAASSMPAEPRDGLLAGAIAYFDAMSAPGRARLLLIEGPAALPPSVVRQIDKQGGADSLREGLAATAPDLPEATVEALAELFSAAFDRAALRIAEGADRAPFELAIGRMLNAMAD